MGLRGDAILSFDYCVGKIMQTLDSLNIADNTIIILTSDNGPVIDDGYQDKAVELLGNHKPSADMRGGKYSAFEAGTRIPFMIKWQNGIHHPSASDVLFSHIDLMASLAKIIGAEIPANSAPDSRDFSDVLTGKKLRSRNYLIEQNVSNKLTIQDAKGWKYIEPGNDPVMIKETNTELGNSPLEQLYNLKTDIGEKKNIAAENPKILIRLRKDLIKEKTKGFMEKN